MSCVCYVPKKFYAKARSVIDQANVICEEYANQDLALTLRQLFYQFVARCLIANIQKEYNRLGRIVSEARLAGDLDWAYIVDRTRELTSLPHWDTPGQIIEAAADQFRLDKWASQPCRVECWVEKNALLGVLESVCPNEDVPFFACVGYASLTAKRDAAQRIGGYLANGQEVVILYLGDHDPSGINMPRELRSRLETFIGHDEGHNVLDLLTVKRIALNGDQVEQYRPPPNTAKQTDSRYSAYLTEFGPQCWELDALEPSLMVDLIRSEIEACRDSALWAVAVEREAGMRNTLDHGARRLLADLEDEE